MSTDKWEGHDEDSLKWHLAIREVKIERLHSLLSAASEEIAYYRNVLEEYATTEMNDIAKKALFKYPKAI